MTEQDVEQSQCLLFVRLPDLDSNFTNLLNRLQKRRKPK